MSLPGRITEHFGWNEAVFTTQRDPRTGLLFDNTPGPEEGARLVHTFKRMEDVRTYFGRPIIVHSAYRSPAVNAAVGGSATSQHMRGEAVDFHVLNIDVPNVFQALRTSSIPYDQLIEEAGTWVHISFVRGSPRRQALRMAIKNGKAAYEEVPRL